jgi:protein-S-isoprenylcysteine O-methyltransferase Ste14
MPGLALALLAVYGILAFGLRAGVQWRRTGSTGLLGLSPEAGLLEWIAGAAFVGGIALCIAGPWLQLDAGLDPIEALDHDGVGVAGACLTVAGTAATLAAQLAMGESWRVGVDPGERTELVTGGVFSLVRNPIYSAMIPTFAGIALMAPNPVTIAGLLLLVAGLEFQVRFVEEPYLARVHGEAYAAYATRVGRFLPGVGRR